MPRHRRHSIEFKRQVVAEYHAGESAHVLGRRHDLSRNLIRIWVEKAGAGELDQDVEAADLLGAYEAKIAALERLVGQQALEIEFLKKAQKIARSPSKRALVRDHRPAGLSVERGCALMGLPRSTYYAAAEGEALGRGDRRRDAGDHRRVRVLRLPPGRRRAAPPRPCGQCQEGAPADARERPQPPDAAALLPHDRQRPRRPDLPVRGAGLRGPRSRPALGRRHHLRRHRAGLRLSHGRFSTPGRGASSATRWPATSRPGTASPPSSGRSRSAARCRAASSTPTAGRSTPARRTARSSPPTASSAR